MDQESVAATVAFTGRRRAPLLGDDRAADVLFGTSYSHPTPSPDGARIAWISDRDGRPKVWVAALPPAGADTAPIAEPDWPLPVDPDEPASGADVQALRWSPDGSWLACEVAPGGSERTRVVLVSPDGAERREIAPAAAAVTLGVWAPGGRQLGVTIHPDRSHDDSGHGQACLVDLRDGTSTVLASGPAVRVCAVSGDGRRVVVRVGRGGARTLELVDLHSGARTNLLPGGSATVADAHFGAGGSQLFLHTDAGRERPSLLSVQLRGGRASAALPLAARDHDDLDLVGFDPSGGRAALAWNVDGRSELELLDLRSGLIGPLPEPPGDVVTGLAFACDGRALLLASEGPTVPPQLARIGLEPGRPALEAFAILPGEPSELQVDVLDALVDPTLHEFSAEDGLTLTGWLFRPRAAFGASPTMIWLHGRPDTQERPVFRPLFQALLAAGIAVFAPNVRGSAGCGRTFGQADEGAGRFTAIADVRAAAAFLTGCGLADATRIGVSGQSDGGHLALAALTWFPELFRVGVDVCGIPDLEAFLARTEPWIAAEVVDGYGHPEHDRDLLRDLSPIHRLDRIAAPLLVVHGRQDGTVPVGEADRVVAALRELGATPGFLVFDDEGHQVRGVANRATFLHEVVRFVSGSLVGVGSRTA